MKVTLMPGIESISGSMKGAMGKRTVFITRTKPDGKKETHMYLRKADDYQRKNPPSQNELAARSLFMRRQALVQQLIEESKKQGLPMPKARAWQIAKQQITNE